jgi:hypothetical protein
MNLGTVPFLVALAASIALLLKVPARLFPLIAAGASALEILRSTDVLRLRIPVLGAPLVFGAAILVGGVGSWIKAGAKVPVTAATLVAVVGLLRVLGLVL